MTILHIEDDDDDAWLLERSFTRAQKGYSIRKIESVEKAVEYLVKTSDQADPENQQPLGLVLLDLKLHGGNGFEVLQWMRTNPRVEGLPVVVLSGSPLEQDKQRARDLGAAAYFEKTPNYADVVAYVTNCFPVHKCGSNAVE